LLVRLGFLTLWAPLASMQKTAWERYRRAGVHAYTQGLYTAAEQQLAAVLKEAERLGLPDQCRAMPLTTLALVIAHRSSLRRPNRGTNVP